MKHLFILLLLFITGCASNSTQKFPDEWARFPKPNGNACPDISGKYENIATTPKGESGLNLAWLIIPGSKEKQDLNSIEFNLDPLQESLRVTARSENGALVGSTLSQRNKDFYCKQGSLIIENNEFVNRDGVIAQNWKSYAVAKTADGLVMRYVDSATGLFFLVPIIGSHKYWYLYKQNP
ncbi:hypothetical protein [Marinomonas posidonica]|uniref:hypothetical protein n=1 Tax=Marinomonas posidonica TaxID=936476 RepID=UPI0037364F35